MRGVVGETVLGRYRLEALLAEGGFGQVWKAHQVRLDRPVALKVLRPERREDPAIRERFRREARLLGSISHPHVVTCHDFDVDSDGDLVLVMEFLQGCTLLDLLRRREVVPLDRIVEWISQAAEGLWEAHAQGIVHRDVKPSNLFIVDPGRRTERVKVIDFGILRADHRVHRDLETLTRTGMIVGTPEYLAPEVALGRPADPFSDQYGLALVAFEMIALRKAFPSWEDGGGLARIGGRPEGMDFAETGRRVPPAVQEVIWRALSPVPEDRHATIRDFGEALRRAAGLGPAGREATTRVSSGPIDGEAETRVSVTRLERRAGIGRWLRTRSGAVTGVVGAVLLALAGISWMVRTGDSGIAEVEEVSTDHGEVGQRREDAAVGDGAGPPETGLAGTERPLAFDGRDGLAVGRDGTGRTEAWDREARDRSPSPRTVRSTGPAGHGSESSAGPRETGARPPDSGTGTGRISLNAMPWAAAFLDGRSLGRTPIREMEVPEGVHEVRLVHPSLGEVRHTVRIAPGETRIVSADLTGGDRAEP